MALSLSQALPFSSGARASRLQPLNATPTVINRRTLSLGLLGVAFAGGERNAVAAARRPPAPPPAERKDPNVSGVQAKIMASKKRKEAMKEEVQKLRQRGKNLPPPAQQEGPPQSE